MRTRRTIIAGIVLLFVVIGLAKVIKLPQKHTDYVVLAEYGTIGVPTATGPVYVFEGDAITLVDSRMTCVFYRNGRTATRPPSSPPYWSSPRNYSSDPVTDGGKHLLYVTHMQSKHDRHLFDWNLHERDIETGQSRLLKTFPTDVYIYDAMYSPDGSHLIVALRPNKIVSQMLGIPCRALWAYDRRTERWTPLTEKSGSVFMLCNWSRNGERIYYLEWKNDLRTASLGQMMISNGKRSAIKTGLKIKLREGWNEVIVLDGGRRFVWVRDDDVLAAQDISTGMETVLEQARGDHHHGDLKIDSSGRYLSAMCGVLEVEVFDLSQLGKRSPRVIARVAPVQFCDWHPSLPRFLVRHRDTKFPWGFMAFPSKGTLQFREYTIENNGRSASRAGNR